MHDTERPGVAGPPPGDSGGSLSHVDAGGAARMVDVGDKPPSARTARAEGAIRMSAAAFALVAENRLAKGDVLAVARVAGVMAAKRTAELIPLCHPIALTHADVALTLDPALPGVRVSATARTIGPTGVEMEALTAASVALLTVYDMAKSADATMEIGTLHLVEKTGGRARELPTPPPTIRGAEAGAGETHGPARPSGAVPASETSPNPMDHG